MTTTETPETPERRPEGGAVKRYLLIGAGIGAGLALVLSAVVGTWSWWQSRPKPWDTTAITCTYSKVTLHDYYTKAGSEFDKMKNYRFEFVCQNNTNEDFVLEPGESDEKNRVVLTHLYADGSINAEYPNTYFSLHRPVMIPVGGKQRVAVSHRVVLPPKGSENVRMMLTAPMQYLKRNNPDMVGFSMMEPERRYQVLFKVPDSAAMTVYR